MTHTHTHTHITHHNLITQARGAPAAQPRPAALRRRGREVAADPRRGHPVGGGGALNPKPYTLNPTP